MSTPDDMVGAGSRSLDAEPLTQDITYHATGSSNERIERTAMDRPRLPSPQPVPSAKLPPPPDTAYSHSQLDRATDRRSNRAWLADLLGGEIEVLTLRNGQCLVDTELLPIVIAGDQAKAVAETAEHRLFLGLAAGRPVLAVDLKSVSEPEALQLVGAAAVDDIRTLVTRLDPTLASRLACAKGLFFWHDHAQFCGMCGQPTVSDAAGHVRTCTASDCGQVLFPQICPAVIVLVESAGTPSRCLLGRHVRSALGGYSTLAGFVEIGESLEEAVRREVAEETGVLVGEVSYVASQSWPFPQGLMLAFRARALTEAVRADGHELAEARWFTRSELRELASATGGRLGRIDSVDRILLEGWLDQGLAGT